MKIFARVCVLAGLLAPALISAQGAQGNGQNAGAAVDLAQKMAIAESIVSRQEALAGRAFDKAWHEQQVQHLSTFSINELMNVQMRDTGVAKTLDSAGGSLLGDSGQDLLFTPIAPCRIIDTRLAGGPVSTQRNFLVAGPTGFPAQGGNNGGCGIPFGPATAVVINLIGVEAQGAGDFRAWAFPAAAPLASVLNYAAVTGLNLANAVLLPICNPAVSVCNFDISMLADGAAAQVVADVLGYFRAVDTVTMRSTNPTTFPSITLPAVGVTGDFFESVSFTPTRNVSCMVTAQLELETNGDTNTFMFFRSAVRNVTAGTTTPDDGWLNAMGGQANVGTVTKTAVFNLTGGQAYRFGMRLSAFGTWAGVQAFPTVAYVCK
jgi:hypothetical protein